jgi:hypothetical protein
MKRSTVIFPLRAYLSLTSGSAAIYRMPQELRSVIGQAKALRYQIVGFERSTNAQLELQMFESAYEDMPADEVIPGATPFHTSGAVTSLRTSPTTVPGPFCTNVEMVLKVSDSTSTAQESWQGLIVATLILEE